VATVQNSSVKSRVTQSSLFRIEDSLEPIRELPFVEEENVVSRKKLKLVDLFAGIGGFHYGVSAAAARFNLGVKTLLVSEIEPSCQQTYAQNHRVEVQGDINTVDLHGVEAGADIVTAGFPCQPFSNSGLKLGLKDPRGQFYFRIEEIIKSYNAKSFILENVSGIRKNGGGNFQSKLSVNPQSIGKTMSFLEDQLLKLRDYSVQWVEIDSSKLGSPQVRKRVYIIGIHRDYARDFSISFAKYAANPFISIVDDVKIKELELSSQQEKNLRSFMKRPPSFHDGMRRVGNAYLCAGGNVGQGYHAHGMVPTLTKVWARFLPIYFPHGRENLPDIGEPEFVPNGFYGRGYLRRASVREVMRLQGFPDSFEPHPNNGIAYEHAGNAVNAKVVREIASLLLAKINK
jgi:DNA (cytosine-5)-methyltransferase 1